MKLFSDRLCTQKGKMRGAFFLSAAVFFLCWNLCSCATAPAAAVPAQKPVRQAVLKMYDNCPELTASLAAQVELKATMENYAGVTAAVCSVPPSLEEMAPVCEYFSFCEKIRKSLEDFSGKKYFLEFNSKSDKSGIPLDLSSSSAALQSAARLIQSDETEIYAFYSCREPDAPASEQRKGQ